MFLTIKKIPKKSWSSKNPFNLRPKLITIFFLVFGLTLFGAGEGLLIVSFTGASPWSVLAQGISLNTDISVGIVTFMVSVSVLSLWIFLKQKPGLGTLFNILIIATMIDVCIIFVPTPEIYFNKLLLAIASVLLVGLGTGFYLIANLGPGPRDGLMTGLQKKKKFSNSICKSVFRNFGCINRVVFRRHCRNRHITFCFWHRSCCSFRIIFSGKIL